jgi:N-acetylneuraminate synthase
MSARGCKTFEIGGRRIGEGRTFVIAEVGTNHDGSLAKAKEMIGIAAECGADAVKFQSFRAEECYPPNIGVVDVPGGAVDFFEFMRSREMPDEWLPGLKKAADSAGILFISTPFHVGAVARLKECGVPAFKVASAEVTHFPLLEAMARAGLPVILSTGFSTLAEIDEAVRFLRENGGGEIMLLQCVGVYPAPAEACNLRVMETLRLAFGLPAGLSDHTMDFWDVGRLAAALGGCAIEKHFTTSRKLKGADHSFAAEPRELKRMIAGIREVDSWPESRKREFAAEERFEKILGCSAKGVAPLEKDIYPCEKRSIRARRDIAAGEVLTAKSVGVLRFTRNGKQGISPRYFAMLVAERPVRAARAIRQGDGVTWEDLIGSEDEQR